MVRRFPQTSTLCQASSSSWLEASSSWLVSEYRRFMYQTARKGLSKLLVQLGRENGSIINRAQSPVLLMTFPELPSNISTILFPLWLQRANQIGTCNSSVSDRSSSEEICWIM